MGQSSQHQPGHRGTDERFARLTEPLVVLTQTTTLPEPAERPLHDPAARQDATKTLGPERLPINDRPDRCPDASRLRGMPNHFHTPAQLRFNPGLSTPCVALIDPHMLQPWKLRLDSLQHQGDSRSVLDRSAVDLDPQDQPLGVHQQVALAPTELLGAIIAPNAPHPSCLDRLAIENACARLCIASRFYPNCLPQGGMQLLPEALQPPTPEIVIHGLPRWQIMGQQAPGAAAAEYIEDAIENLAHRVDPRPPSGLGRWDVRRQTAPLGVSHIRRITLSVVHSPYSVAMVGAADHFSDSF